MFSAAVDAGRMAAEGGKVDPDAVESALSEIEPPHIVASQENTFTPVGTAITIVAKTK